MASSLGRLGFSALLLALAAGCNQAIASEPAAKTKKEQTEKPAASAAPNDTGAHGSKGEAKYAVPFAWESSPDDPLAVARSFMGEVVRDNKSHAALGVKVFAEYRDVQKPRATVVTCSDSRVHTSAFDETPENDVFMIKNIGNQLENAEGSVEYGVEHLNTPVLFVIGHTGCGAVKAAIEGELSKLSKPVRAELEHLKLPELTEKDENAAWAEAVVANVRNQVAHAVEHFGGRVQQGKLTVVGAVYDFRNDLGQGAGKITIVDVNGNDEPERMKAFVTAISTPGPSLRSATRAKRRGEASMEATATDDAAGPSGASQGPSGASLGQKAWSPNDLAKALADLEARQSKPKPKH
ncbi:MAG: carbonic anhydrase [Myxococcota bacterium]|jgi:carbonic anhydrase|nr:carbonic anhydrase [Myxococcota bacterium]